MKEPIIFTEAQFKKGEANFQRYGADYEWISCPEQEEVLVARIRDKKARVV